MIQTVEVGAWIGSTATGRASDHPGGRTANVAASVSDVRQAGEANTSVNMSIMGSRQYRPPVSGAVRTIGPLLRSRNAEEYSVSKLGRTTVLKSAGELAKMAEGVRRRMPGHLARLDVGRPPVGDLHRYQGVKVEVRLDPQALDIGKRISHPLDRRQSRTALENQTIARMDTASDRPTHGQVPKPGARATDLLGGLRAPRSRGRPSPWRKTCRQACRR